MQQIDLLRLSLSLVLVVILILVAAWLARRSGLLRNKGQTTIQIIASQSLGARNNIIVVEIEKQRLVLGVSQQQINLLHILPNPLEQTLFTSELQHAIHHQKKTTHSENNAS